jgi:hypothetical protein
MQNLKRMYLKNNMYTESVYIQFHSSVFKYSDMLLYYEEKKPLERPRHRWWDNVKIELDSS